MKKILIVLVLILGLHYLLVSCTDFDVKPQRTEIPGGGGGIDPMKK